MSPAPKRRRANPKLAALLERTAGLAAIGCGEREVPKTTSFRLDDSPFVLLLIGERPEVTRWGRIGVADKALQSSLFFARAAGRRAVVCPRAIVAGRQLSGVEIIGIDERTLSDELILDLDRMTLPTQPARGVAPDVDAAVDLVSLYERGVPLVLATGAITKDGWDGWRFGWRTEDSDDGLITVAMETDGGLSLRGRCKLNSGGAYPPSFVFRVSPVNGRPEDTYTLLLGQDAAREVLEAVRRFVRPGTARQRPSGYVEG